MTLAFVAVGSNLGDRHSNVEQARKLLEQTEGVSHLRSSKIYETDPVGGPPQGKYLNAVWEMETSLSPEDLFRRLEAIEKELGRSRPVPLAPRTMDLDLLFYGDRAVKKAELEVPHPRLQERMFVLEPLCELRPDWIHPVLKKTALQLKEKLLAGHQKS